MKPKKPFRNKYIGIKCKYPGCLYQARCKGYCVNYYNEYIKEKGDKK